ncbi:hypothetical protein Moror_13496 [Moniliophthora roreri MCA 2997]|uniref:Uncharacterized protein n=1 Tax=Moniliophthora roreri (strain MCA 2997) TaxID=1381753 RepID=V2WAM4_MONRO|nr:hypothetical protein Moror_13496 [Moniliophthora roreri MCA 2997]KAI3602121.1 hypothetical protein WG66_000359 [Moniliophthora roreri]
MWHFSAHLALGSTCELSGERPAGLGRWGSEASITTQLLFTRVVGSGLIGRSELSPSLVETSRARTTSNQLAGPISNPLRRRLPVQTPLPQNVPKRRPFTLGFFLDPAGPMPRHKLHRQFPSWRSHVNYAATGDAADRNHLLHTLTLSSILASVVIIRLTLVLYGLYLYASAQSSSLD